MVHRVALVPQALLDASQRATPSTSCALPQQPSENASGLSFLTLPHPRTAVPTLFLPYVSPGSEEDPSARHEILEIQSVDPTASRSWFMEDDTIVEDGRLYMFTPIDPAFLLLPILEATIPDDGSPGKFRTSDDLFQIAAVKLSNNDDEGVDEPEQRKLRDDITRFSELKCVKDALGRVTDIQTLDKKNLTVYRFSLPKTLELLRTKVARLSTQEFAQASRSIGRSLAKDGLGPNEKNSEDLRQEGRTKLACQLVSQYLPENISEALLESYSFTTLDAHLESLETEAFLPVASSTANGKGDTGKKGSATAGPNGNPKKRKAETQASNGVKKLQKTDTTGMNKLTSFFAKGKKNEKAADKGEETDGKEDQ